MPATQQRTRKKNPIEVMTRHSPRNSLRGKEKLPGIEDLVLAPVNVLIETSESTLRSCRKLIRISAWFDLPPMRDRTANPQIRHPRATTSGGGRWFNGIELGYGTHQNPSSTIRGPNFNWKRQPRLSSCLAFFSSATTFTIQDQHMPISRAI